MVIDVHTHIWASNYKQTKEDLLKAMDRYHIDRIYVSGLEGYTPTKEKVDELNDEVARFMKENKERVGGYVYVSPEHDNATEVIRRGIEDQGMEGIKLWVSTFCDDVCVNPVMEQAIFYGVPVLMHTFHKANGQVPNESLGNHIANIARRYPEAKILMAHLGGNCYHGLPAIRDCKNVWTDFSGSIYVGDAIEYAVDLLGADRVLFGTDMIGSYLVNLGQVLEADLSWEEKDKILYKNALHLFDKEFRL